jgi:hypothetical protein
MAGIQDVNSIIHEFLVKITANFSINQTTLNLPPILLIAHSLLQPIRIISQLILLIPLPGQNLTGTFIGHDKSENREAEEQDDEEKHD